MQVSCAIIKADTNVRDMERQMDFMVFASLDCSSGSELLAIARFLLKPLGVSQATLRIKHHQRPVGISRKSKRDFDLAVLTNNSPSLILPGCSSTKTRALTGGVFFLFPDLQ